MKCVNFQRHSPTPPVQPTEQKLIAVGSIRVFMDGIAHHPPFKVAITSVNKTTDALPVGEYTIYTSASDQPAREWVGLSDADRTVLWASHGLFDSQIDAVCKVLREKNAGLPADRQCWCETCDVLTNNGLRTRMSLCPNCGNKRCPRASHHDNACTGSNEVGQTGSSWERVKPITADINSDEPVRYEYRWLNPANNPNEEPANLKWKVLECDAHDTIHDKIQRLESYRYNGKPVYEVRALYTRKVIRN